MRFNGKDFSPASSFKLLSKAYQVAAEKGTEVKVGTILSSDAFYNDDRKAWKKWREYGVLGVEMESAELLTLAAKYGVDALSILTVSDSLVTGKETTAEEREKTFTDMMEIALELAE